MPAMEAYCSNLALSADCKKDEMVSCVASSSNRFESDLRTDLAKELDPDLFPLSADSKPPPSESPPPMPPLNKLPKNPAPDGSLSPLVLLFERRDSRRAVLEASGDDDDDDDDDDDAEEVPSGLANKFPKEDMESAISPGRGEVSRMSFP